MAPPSRVSGRAPRSRERPAALLGAVLLLVGAPSLSRAGENRFHRLTPDAPIDIDSSAGEVRLLADLQAKSFEGGSFSQMAGYHALVWKEGDAAKEALLATYVDDVTLHDALLAIGATPGNNLTRETWEERRNGKNPAADVRIAGTPVDMLVWWPALGEPVPIDSLLIDREGLGIDLRFGGNLNLIPIWRSGCIVCLYSCPGSKVGNRAYTVRDYVNETTIFSVNWDLTPKEEMQAVVILRKREM